MNLAAVVQMVTSSDIKTNLAYIDTYLKDAAEKEIKLIVLPENFALMGLYDTDKIHAAEIFGKGIIQEHIQALAKRYGIWIIAGTIPIKASKNRMRASSMVYDNTGTCVARYDKIHLFDVQVSEHDIYHESATTEAGNSLVVVDTPIGKIGLTVCYDLRFPELYQLLRQKGAQIFTVPSAFTTITGKAHWEVLLRARAIENLCYVLAPNQGGLHDNKRETYGHSMIIEPWGSIIANATDNCLITANIDLLALENLRQRFPCHAHHVLIGR